MGPVQKYVARAESANSLVCVGLDADFDKIPARFKDKEFPQFEFNKWVIEQTHEYVAAYKPNAAFYDAHGDQGLRELKMTMEYLIAEHPDIFTILDAKRGDIGNTNNGYITAIFDWLGFDAMTMHPYMGKESLQPFLDRADKVSIILCRTSNPGAGEFQDLVTGEKPLYQVVAEKVSREWNTNGNCMLVVGATVTDEMKLIRASVPDMTFLVPGIGAQGGSVEAVVKAGLDADKKGMIINSARSIIFSDDPAREAKKLRDEINYHRSKCNAYASRDERVS